MPHGSDGNLPIFFWWAYLIRVYMNQCNI